MAVLPPRILTARTAREAGYSVARVRHEVGRGRWQRLCQGVYLTRPDPPTREDWLEVALALSGPAGVISGWDAVRAHHLGGDRPPAPDVLVLSPAGACRTIGLARVRASSRPLRVARRRIDGLGVRPVAGVARAVADTSLQYRRLEPVRALVLSAVQLGRCTGDDLAVELAAGPRNASAHLRRAVTDALDGARSIAEAELADVLRGGDLPAFELNVELVDESGVLVAVADVLWRSLRAVLEVDSRRHHFLEPAWERTMARHNRLARYGFAATHYPPRVIRARPDGTRAEIEAWLRSRAAELGVPYPPPDLPADRRMVVRLTR